MQTKELVVRACDVGYGHVKLTDGRDSVTDLLRTDSIPSQSPSVKDEAKKESGVVMSHRDTFVVPVGNRLYEVGRDVRLALHGNHESEVLDANFALSDAYAARLFGAMNYMLPALPDHTIDILVLGLPLNTFNRHRSALQKRFLGPHVINQSGATVDIRSCNVYPQPLGSYAAYLAEIDQQQTTPMALIIDPGYNTVDWFVCHGMVANEVRSSAVQRGMGAVMRAIAEDIIKKHGFDATPAEVVRAIDRALVRGHQLEMYGHPLELAEHMATGFDVIEEAAQAVKNNVGSGSDIDVIILTGGGASLYMDAFQQKFPLHKVVTLPSPALANVRGFHLIGERLAKSRQRALSQRDAAVV